MRSSKSNPLHEFLQVHTPHLDPKWAMRLTTELRLIGVSGRDTGSALAELDVRCDESGESAQASYGDPVAFARTLDLPATPLPPPKLSRHMGHTCAGFVGMAFIFKGLDAWRDGTQAVISVGDILAVAIAVLTVLAFIRWRVAAFRMALSRSWAPTMLIALALISGVVVTRLVRTPALVLPTMAALAIGLVLLTVSGLLVSRAYTPAQPDPLVINDEPIRLAQGTGSSRLTLDRVLPWTYLFVTAWTYLVATASGALVWALLDRL